MSEQGKLIRGEQYHAMRDLDGKYPNGITSNPDKMSDLQFYLDSIKESQPTTASGEKKEDKKKEVK